MTYYTPEARQRLDEYLSAVRSALAGCRSVDADEIEQDICAHIGAEFPPSYGPVSNLALEPVLARLGEPEQWVPEEERSALWRAAERIRHLGARGTKVGTAAAGRLWHLRGQARRIGGEVLGRLRRLPDNARRAGGAVYARMPQWRAPEAPPERMTGDSILLKPEDWKLAHLAFGLLVLGLIIPPLLIGLLPASFCAARAALNVARERGEPLGARRWLIYPPLVLVGFFVGAILLLWPIAPGVGLAETLWHSHRKDLIAYLPLPRDATEALVYVYCIAGTLAAWLVVLGSALYAMPRLAVVLFRPFADGFGRRQAGGMLMTGLGVLVLCVGFAVRTLNDESFPVNQSANNRVTHVESMDLPRR